MSKIPAYERVYQQLKKEIIAGEYQVGELLPTEGELGNRFNVSRTTIRKAMENLSTQRFVSIKQGHGTRVIDYRTQQNLNEVTSISETLRKKGYEVKSRSMYIDVVEANSHIAKYLDVNENDPVVRIQRVQVADEKPIAIMKNYLIPNMVPGIEGYVNQFSSLYQFLEERFNIDIEAAKNKISARVADFNEAEMLSVKVGAPLLFIQRICYNGGRPICLDEISIVGDVYEFEVMMEGRIDSTI